MAEIYIRTVLHQTAFYYRYIEACLNIFHSDNKDWVWHKTTHSDLKSSLSQESTVQQSARGRVCSSKARAERKEITGQESSH